MHHGFHGRLLRVDLTTGATDEVGFSREDVATWLLGSGLAAKLLYYDFDPCVEPLAPEAPLLFLSGLFTGSPLPGTSKHCVVARSPLTGIWNEATVGGHWPAELRRTGWDGVLFVGRSEVPVWLSLTKDRAELKPAGDLWGLDTYELEARMRPGLGRKPRIAAIGPAGERCSPIACVVFDAPISRIAARGGIGAVMGSKRLKAVVVEGDGDLRPSIADLDGLKEQLKVDVAMVQGNTQALRAFGTSGGITTVERNGELPIKNWQLGSWKAGARRISGQEMQPDYLDRHYSCWGCPVRCGKIYKVAALGLAGHGPEFESLGMLGANCLNDEPERVIEANELCNRYGVDSISAGSCAAFGIEAFERGLLTEAETGGVRLDWSGDTVVHLIGLIGRGEGVGELLGMGVRKAAELLGHGAEDFAVHTKGLEYPAHDPRGHVSMALSYATSARGACHLEGLTFFLDRGVKVPDLGFLEAPDPHDSSDKPPIVMAMQDYMSVFNPLGMCKFMFLGGVGPAIIARWLRLTCGFDVDQDGVMETGARLFNLKRMYNVRLGISRKDDVLPRRLLAEAKLDGAAAGVLPDMASMLHRYYELRGWSPDGIPTSETLARLGVQSRPPR